MLNGLQFTIYIALKYNYFLIIDCERHAGFNQPFSKIFKINEPKLKYSDSYDNIPTHYTFYNNSISTIKKERIKYDSKTDGYNFLGHNICLNENQLVNQKSNIIIFAGYGGFCKKKYKFEVQFEIKEKLNKEVLINEEYISVHFRNTDKKNKINEFINKVYLISKKTNIKTIYLASDDYFAYDEFKKKMPNLNIIRLTIPPKNIKCLHYGEKNKEKEIYECLRDQYFILKSKYFIPSLNSSLSQLIINQINNSNMFSIKCKTIIV